MSYAIEQDPRRGFGGTYQYSIYKDGRLIAHYWHDHRGDDHGIEFIDGTKEGWPVGNMTDFLQGGGPEPLTLSARAVAYLEARQA